jgi:hypothetical protein
LFLPVEKGRNFYANSRTKGELYLIFYKYFVNVKFAVINYWEVKK